MVTVTLLILSLGFGNVHEVADLVLGIGREVWLLGGQDVVL